MDMKSSEKKRILVTGCSGFLAAHLLQPAQQVGGQEPGAAGDQDPLLFAVFHVHPRKKA